MDCVRARFLLYAYLDRELCASEAQCLERHVARCAPCAARAASARGVLRILRTRLDRPPAPFQLRQRLNGGRWIEPRPRTAFAAVAATLVFLILPLASDVAGRRPATPDVAAGAALPGGFSPASAEAGPLSFVSKRMTGTFVCLRCENRSEAGLCAIAEPTHEAGFCADNGEVWRLMSPDSSLVGRTATVEGVAFPQSGFLRAHRVGY